jgi:quercetin dioxygenase-like cupin family protein
VNDTTGDDRGSGAAEARLVRADEGIDVKLGRIVLDGAATAGRLAAIDMRARPGVVVPGHIHRDAEELFFMLEGELIVRVGPDEYTVGPGDLVYIPRGVVHAHRNRAGVPTRWLTLFTPAGSEGYFAERAHLAGTAGNGVELDYAGLEPAVHDALRARYGIVVSDE